jgi:hypothetical protein
VPHKSRLQRRANHWFNFARLTADEGRVAIVTNVAVRCGGREGLRKTNVALADGEVVWSWRPKAGAKLCEMTRSDGDNKAWSPGRARISRKTIAQGRPVVRLVPVVLPRAFLLHADHGCGGHPVFPAPSCVIERVQLTQGSGASRRENAKLCHQTA